MKNIMIIGLGAIGTCVASRFVDNGVNLTALCDEERKKRYEKDGFYINDKRYDFNYTTADSYGKIADLIIVSTKYYSLKDAIKDIDEVVDENTIIVSVLNGVDSEEIIGEKVGIEKVLYGYVYTTDAVKVKNRTNYKSQETIVYGEGNGQITNRVKEVEKTLNNAGVLCEPKEDMLTALWWKYMANIGINQVSCILKANYGVLTTFEPTWELASMAMRECIVVANAKGIKLDESCINKVHASLSKINPYAKTSMYQDVEAKRKTELDMLGIKLCKMGKELGIKTPVNDVLVRQIQTIEHNY